MDPFYNPPLGVPMLGDYPGQFSTPGDGGMVAPPGWVSPTTPGSATVKCGNITQTTQFTTTESVPTVIGFTTPATWSDRSSFISDYGLIWGCQTPGIYNLRFNQTLDVTALSPPPDSSIDVIPNTTFYFDLDGVDLPPPQVGNMVLHPSGLESTVTYTGAAGGEPDVLMTSFVSAPGFLTNLVVPGGLWSLSLYGLTDDTTESNSFYIKVYKVDADGSSNPIEIFNGQSTTATMTASDVPYNYNLLQIISTFDVSDLTKRILVEIYANFGIVEGGSTITFYFRGLTVSNITTTVTQDVVPPITDTVNLSITVDSATSEFNQVFSTSIPITTIFGNTATYSASVNAIANVFTGDQVTCSIVSVLGNVAATSGQTTLPTPANTLQWNLIAQGAYGNVGVIV